MMHGIDEPHIDYKDTLSKSFTEESEYDIVMANPPFTGSIDKGDINENLTLPTTKTELLFVENIFRLLKKGGTAGVIVPQGVLFGNGRAFRDLRKTLLERCDLKALITMPCGVFKPYAGVSTAVLLFTKVWGTKDKVTKPATEQVWFYEMASDGYSLDDKRSKSKTSEGKDDYGDLIDIVEKFKARNAENCSYLLKTLATELAPEYGTSFSVRQLERCRQFYKEFPIASALRTQFSWTHYKLLISLENNGKREYYESEAAKNNWSSRQLERQINSQLFERLLLSNDKERVLAVARGEQLSEKATDIIKDPMYLEFLGLKREAAYYEKDLEQAIITQMQEFLLELGNGFTFVARQKRLHLDGDDFFADLVFYNRLLHCFVIIELKTHKLTHQDLGQLQMYVNYYDRYEKLPDENPTIGILLAAEKNDAMVKISLPQDNTTVLASQYKLYLPSEETLRLELERELNELQRNK
jgi:predicted nuclease of restriction endonuclease-like (RecB) superfamily